MLSRWLFVAMVSSFVGCGTTENAPVDSGEGTVYTLDLTGFGTTQEPGGLRISQHTLVFPIALGPTKQSLSPSNPGDLLAAYTRVGCSIDLKAWVADNASVIQVRQVQAVALTEITIDQFVAVGVTSTPDELAKNTCLTLKSQNGDWMPFLQPQKVTLLSNDSVRVTFAIDRAIADSAAIFLPTYTKVSAITYRVPAPTP